MTFWSNVKCIIIVINLEMIINMDDTLHEFEYNLNVNFVIVFINMVGKITQSKVILLK